MDIHSLSPTSLSERHDSPMNVFFIWLAGTMTASAIPVGAVIVQQFPSIPLIYPIIIACLMYVIVGIISLPGFLFGIPSMVASEHSFGHSTNRIVSLSNWLAQVGWESILLVIVSYIIRAILFSGYANYSILDTGIAFSIAILFNFIIPIIGYRAIVKTQEYSSFILLAFAVVVLFSIPLHISELASWKGVAHYPILDIMGAVSIGLMGGAFSWTMYSSDYSRFIKKDSGLFSVIIAPSAGGFIGHLIIMVTSVALYMDGGIKFNTTGIAISSAIFMNKFLYYGFTIFSIIGLLAANYLNSYSSAFSLATVVGTDYNRKWFTAADAALAVVISSCIIFVAPSFIAVFRIFLSLIIVIAAPWTGIMTVNIIIDLIIKKSDNIQSIGAFRKFNSWVLWPSVLCTSLFASNSIFEGYGASLFSGINLSPIVGFIIALTGTLIVRIVNSAFQTVSVVDLR